jgi:hypothetical protein
MGQDHSRRWRRRKLVEGTPGMRHVSKLISRLIIIAGTSSACGPAGAAVRVCADLLVGASAPAATEAQARQQALDQWSSQAAVHGPNYTSWRLAIDRQIVCAPLPGPQSGPQSGPQPGPQSGPQSKQTGTASACAARARPCRIEQAPNRKPVPPPASPAATRGAKPLNI